MPVQRWNNSGNRDCSMEGWPGKRHKRTGSKIQQTILTHITLFPVVLPYWGMGKRTYVDKMHKKGNVVITFGTMVKREVGKNGKYPR